MTEPPGSEPTAQRGQIVRRDEGAPGMDCVFMMTGEDSGGRFDFMIATVEYLSGPPLHIHREQDDTFYVLRGTLACQLGEEICYIGPGDLVRVPPGVPHTFDNVDRSQDPVVAVNLMTPGGFRPFMDDLSAALRDGPLTPGAASRFTSQYGVEWVGPPLRDRLGLT